MDWLIKILKFVYNYKSIFELFVKKPQVQTETFEEKAMVVYNMITAKYGANPIKVNESLVKACQSHAEWMEITKKLTHIGSFGKTARQRALAAGYKGTYIAEHVFTCKNCDEQSAIESLMDLLSAREDLRENFRDFGIGNSGRYWCVILAR